MSMSAIDIMIDVKANAIAYTKKVLLCHPKDKQKIEESLSEEELDSLFIVSESNFKQGKAYAITDFNLAKGIVANELRKQRESEVSGNEYDGE